MRTIALFCVALVALVTLAVTDADEPGPSTKPADAEIRIYVRATEYTQGDTDEHARIPVIVELANQTDSKIEGFAPLALSVFFAGQARDGRSTYFAEIAMIEFELTLTHPQQIAVASPANWKPQLVRLNVSPHETQLMKCELPGWAFAADSVTISAHLRKGARVICSSDKIEMKNVKR